MKVVWILLATLVIYSGYQIIRVTRLVQVSTKLVVEARPFERIGGTRSLLVLGDSTAVGVGSPSTKTVAARLGYDLDTSVENLAKSGARTDDVGGQLKNVRQTRYDVVLIQVGANDVIRFSAIKDVSASINAVLEKARELSPYVVLLTGGKIGDAPFFPRPFGFLWKNRAAAVREEFIAAAEMRDVLYVDLYSIPSPFESAPERYYAADGLHLTGDGYGFWFDETQKAIERKWPEL